LSVSKTLNWNTATAPGFYTNDGVEQTINGPGDALNPPRTVGVVQLHENGAIVQRVWDVNVAALSGFRRRHVDRVGHRSDQTAGVDCHAGVSMVTPRTEMSAISRKRGDEGSGHSLEVPLRQDGDLRASAKWLFAGGQGFYDINDSDTFYGERRTPAGDAMVPLHRICTPHLPGNYTVKFGARMYANPSGGATGTPASMIMYVEQMRAGAVVNSAAIDSWLPGMPVQSFTAAVRESNEERFSCQVGDVLRVRTYSPTYNGAFEQPFMRVRPCASPCKHSIRRST
jgi:hypothetical protein